MKKQCQKTMTLGSAAVAAALFAGIAKVQEESSQERNVKISGSSARHGVIHEPMEDESRPTKIQPVQSRQVSAQASSTRTAHSRHATPAWRDESATGPPEQTKSIRRTRDRMMSAVRQPETSETAAMSMDDGRHPAYGGTFDAAVPLPEPVVEEARLPVALAIPATNSDMLTDLEREVVGKHTEEFQDAVDSVSHLDEDDPAYFDAWKAAQRRRDEQLRLTLGWERFNLLSASAASNVTERP